MILQVEAESQTLSDEIMIIERPIHEAMKLAITFANSEQRLTEMIHIF